jgi:hypothetical protein
MTTIFPIASERSNSEAQLDTSSTNDAAESKQLTKLPGLAVSSGSHLSASLRTKQRCPLGDRAHALFDYGLTAQLRNPTVDTRNPSAPAQFVDQLRESMGRGGRTNSTLPVWSRAARSCPTWSPIRIPFARGEIARNRNYIHCDDPATTPKAISTDLGAQLLTQKSVI